MEDTSRQQRPEMAKAKEKKIPSYCKSWITSTSHGFHPIINHGFYPIINQESRPMKNLDPIPLPCRRLHAAIVSPEQRVVIGLCPLQQSLQCIHILYCLKQFHIRHQFLNYVLSLGTCVTNPCDSEVSLI